MRERVYGVGVEGRSAPRQIFEDCCATRPGFPPNLLNVALAELIRGPLEAALKPAFGYLPNGCFREPKAERRRS